jgi:hypothetical protein
VSCVMATTRAIGEEQARGVLKKMTSKKGLWEGSFIKIPATIGL